MLDLGGGRVMSIVYKLLVAIAVVVVVIGGLWVSGA